MLNQLFKMLLHIFIFTFSAILMLWYGWHLVFGSRGLYEIVRQDKETLVASTYREELREEYKDVFHKVNLLNPENPDLDYLDEKIRYFLSLQKANEVVFSFDNEE